MLTFNQWGCEAAPVRFGIDVLLPCDAIERIRR